MKTYKIIGQTDAYIASRDIRFNGKTEITLVENQPLEQAREKLDSFFSEDYGNSHNIVIGDDGEVINQVDQRWTDYPDGTASYEFDSRFYKIVEE